MRALKHAHQIQMRETDRVADFSNSRRFIAQPHRTALSLSIRAPQPLQCVRQSGVASRTQRLFTLVQQEFRRNADVDGLPRQKLVGGKARVV